MEPGDQQAAAPGLSGDRPGEPAARRHHRRAYLASILATIDGPIVLVGHSYGGAVITNAATGNPNVKALVYVAAFAPDEGESLATISHDYPNSELAASVLPRPYPDGVDLYINPDAFREVFAADSTSRHRRTDGRRPAAARSRWLHRRLRNPGMEDDPELVPRRQQRPSDRPRCGTGYG